MRLWLGTTDDDPAFPDTLLEPALQQGYDSLCEDIRQLNADYFATTVTLAAVSATSHQYNLAAQAALFASYLDVRYDDDQGAMLRECRFDELPVVGDAFFALSGPDAALVLFTSPGSPAGQPLWMRYAAWPATFADDNAAPTLIPERFHDVVGLEALFVFGVGGEQSLPRELRDRWTTRRAQLLSHCSRRGSGVSRTRFVDEE